MIVNFDRLFLKFRRHRNFTDRLQFYALGELSAVFCRVIELIIAATVAVVIFSLTLFRHILLNSTLSLLKVAFTQVKYSFTGTQYAVTSTFFFKVAFTQVKHSFTHTQYPVISTLSFLNSTLSFLK